MIRIDVEGVAASVAKFAAMAAAVQPAADLGTKAGAAVVEEYAQANVPVRSGRLRDSIHVEEDDEGGVLVGSDVEYALYVEEGTSDTPAEPYLRPALDASGEEVNAAVSAAVGAVLR